MLCVVSKKTIDESNWVPFKIGYGHAAIIDKTALESSKDKKIKLSILTLKDLSEELLPEYMQLGYIMKVTIGLNDYISELIGRSKSVLITGSRLFSNTMTNHPLNNILNSQK